MCSVTLEKIIHLSHHNTDSQPRNTKQLHWGRHGSALAKARLIQQPHGLLMAWCLKNLTLAPCNTEYQLSTSYNRETINTVAQKGTSADTPSSQENIYETKGWHFTQTRFITTIKIKHLIHIHKETNYETNINGTGGILKISKFKIKFKFELETPWSRSQVLYQSATLA